MAFLLGTLSDAVFSVGGIRRHVMLVRFIICVVNFFDHLIHVVCARFLSFPL